MSSFKSYKIRDGVHLPSEKFKENWDSIFGKKPKKETMKKEDENVLNALADLNTNDLMGLIEKGKNKEAISVGVKMGLTKKDVEKTIKDYAKATKEG